LACGNNLGSIIPTYLIYILWIKGELVVERVDQVTKD
jgi:hypothetical protein